MAAGMVCGLISAMADPVSIQVDQSVAAGDNSLDGQDVIVDGATLTVDGAHAFNSLRLTHGGWVSHPANDVDTNHMVYLTLGSLTVDADSGIDASGKGYPTGNGPGHTVGGYQYGAGGGYAGNGGYSRDSSGGQSYGSLFEPTDLGSGGGVAGAWNTPGGSGGGAIRIVVSGVLALDGQLAANGGAGSVTGGGGGGGGAGGSLYIRAGTLSGSGSFSANGGAGAGSDRASGGGSGGRIAIYYETNSFSGVITATGGAGYSAGAAGTIYLKDNGRLLGDLLVVNTGVASPWTPLSLGSAFNHIRVDGAAVLFLSGTNNWSAEQALVTGGGELVMGGGLTLAVNGQLTVQTNSTILCQGSGATGQSGGQWMGTGATISAQSVHIEQGAILTADGSGYAPATGPGFGNNGYTYGAGGGYGGNGGYSRDVGSEGMTYGSLYEPLDLGSGGGYANAWGTPGGWGGGAIHLVVSNELVVDGRLTANGNDGLVTGGGGGGGGAGGSLLLSAGALVGSGTISVNGGTGAGSDRCTGGGAGGRIAVYYKTNLFAGQMSAAGGGFYTFGAAGTIYLKDQGQALGDLLVNNLSASGRWTPLSAGAAFNKLTVAGEGILNLAGTNDWSAQKVIVTGAGTLVIQGGLTLTVNGLALVQSNSTILCQSIGATALINSQWGGAGVTINALGVQVEDGGAITADANGYGPADGPGAGVNGYTYGAGAGFGGNGGRSRDTGSTGGAYGSLYEPADLGSGGGYANAWGTPGGWGGGAIRLIVSGELAVDGEVTANASNGNVTGGGGGGGGAGGSVWLSAGVFSGHGLVSANGGDGAGSDVGTGGGAGGRIAIYSTANSFSGAIRAVGGRGNGIGAAGTVYSRNIAQRLGELTIDNAGRSGPPTPWALGADFDKITVSAQAVLHLTGTRNWTAQQLSVTDGATVMIDGGLVLTVDGLLTVGSNSVAACYSKNISAVNNQWMGAGVLISARQVRVDEGGAILADGLGYPSATGPGNGINGYTYGAGGGYAGLGGNSRDSQGGGTYGSLTEPLDLGSGGGVANAWGTPGGAGGGAIRLVVTGDLTVNGRVSANATDGIVTGGCGGGGGAGGSLYLVAGSLSGSGVIQASGGRGAGSDVQTGGGSGGRIAIYYSENNFTGTVAATGGAGRTYGGAGTVFMKNSAIRLGDLIVDNNGFSGQWTPWPSGEDFGSIEVAGNAVLYLAGGQSWSARDVLSTNGAALVLGGGVSLKVDAAMMVASNSAITFQGQNVSGTVADQWAGKGATISAWDLQVDAGATFNADGGGYAPGNGPGAGQAGWVYGAGGGDGGLGGNSSEAAGGASYGSALEPLDLGSGGGSANAWGLPGGSGGGAIHLVVENQLTVNGLLTANGVTGNPNGGGGGGGGAGGSLYLAAGALLGGGSITASGASGAGSDARTGGGGGGRIALYSTVNTFSGQIAAGGGSGWMFGGDGSVQQQVAPSCIVSPGHGATNVSPIVFTLTFDTPVSGLTLDGIVVSNGLKSSLSGSGAIYTVSVIPSAQGEVTCQVPFGSAQDGGGNGNSASSIGAIHYDTDAPTGTVIINQGDSFITYPLAMLYATATDTGSGVELARFSSNNIAWTPWETFLGQRQWNLSPDDGDKKVYAQFRDRAGNISQVVTGSVTIYTGATLAAFTLTPPSLGNETTNVFNVGGMGVVTYSYSLDGGPWSVPAPVAMPITLNGLSDGDHVLAVIGSDALGNWQSRGAATLYHWNIDTVPPVVSQLDPVTGTTNVDVRPALKITFSQDVYAGGGSIGIKRFADDQVQELIPASSGEVVMGDETGSGLGRRLVTIRPAALAPSTQYYVAMDTTCFKDVAGNYFAGIGDKSSWTFTTLVDTAPPSLTITSGPSDQSWLAVATAAFTWTASDLVDNPSQLRFRWRLDMGNWSGWTAGLNQTFSALADGLHQFDLAAEDSSGNVSMVITRHFGVDTQPPTLTAINAAAFQTRALITWKSSEPANSAVDFGTDGAYGQSASAGDLVTDHAVLLTDLMPGQLYHYRVKSADQVGNPAASGDNVFTTVAAPDLQVVSISPAPGTNIWSDQSFNLSWVVTNASAVAANGGWTEGVYLSTNGQFEGASLLAEFRLTGGLSGGQGSSRLQPVTIRRAGLTNWSTYYLVVAVDTHNEIVEGYYETNNWLALPITIEIAPDTNAPSTTIVGGPADNATVGSSGVQFAVTGADDLTAPADLRFYWRLDGGTWQGPVGQGTISLPDHLSAGAHVFEVRAMDAAGNVDPNAQSRRIAVDTTPPVISNVAADTITDTSAVVRWSTSEPGTSTVEYYLLDNSTVTNRQSDGQYALGHAMGVSQLAPNSIYGFRVRSTDFYGNESISASGQFQTLVDTVAPDTQFTQVPGQYARPGTIHFGWTGLDDATPVNQLLYQYQLDGQDWTPANPALDTSVNISITAVGSHVIRVRATDAAGNTDPTPDQFTFTIDDSPPIISGLQVTDIAFDSATVRWQTSKPAAGTVQFATLTGAFRDIGGDGYAVTHAVGIGPFVANTSYRVRVVAVDYAGNQTTSDPITFATLPGCDLGTTSGDLIFSTNSPMSGDAFSFSARIRNLGNVKTSATVVFYDYTVSGGSTEISRQHIDGLPPQMSVNVSSASWNIAPSGSHRPWVKITDVDPVDNNLANNGADREVVVRAQPAAIVTNSLAFIVSNPQSWPGNDSQFSVNIKNTGNQPQSIVDAQITGVDWITLISTLPATPLAPGEELTVTFHMLVPADEPGGPASSPATRPVTLRVTGAALYAQDFKVELFSTPLSTVDVTVLDDVTGEPLSNATIALEDSDRQWFTDSLGKASVSTLAGSHTVFAVAQAHLPASVGVVADSGANPVLLRLKPGQPLEVREVTVTPLTPDEAQNRGVNLSDPVNNWVYDFVVYANVTPISLQNIELPRAPEAGQRVSFSASYSGGGGGGGGYGGPSGGSGGGGGGGGGSYTVVADIYYPVAGDPTQRVETYIVIPGDIRIYKQFWDATVVVKNNCSEGFEIDDVVAGLQLPSGIGLPDLYGQPQPATQSMGTLLSQEQKTASWVIRGDVAGKYRVTGVANGDLVLGGSKVPLVSSLQSDEFEVVQPKLDVVFTLPDFVYAGEEFNFSIAVRNRSTIPIYGVAVDLKPEKFVNCALADGETATKSIGAMGVGQTNRVNFRLVSLVTGQINLDRSFVVSDPNIQPTLTIAPGNASSSYYLLSHPKIVNGSKFEMLFYCPIGQRFVVQRTADLTNWTTVQDFISSESSVVITDSGLGNIGIYKVLVNP